MTPLVAPPAAHADLDDLFDILNTDLFGTATGDISFFNGDDAMDVFTNLHADLEGWLADTDNSALIAQINDPWIDLFGRGLIGNGDADWDGTNDSMFGWLGLGNLNDGGFLFGDGAVGGVDTDGNGLAGGDAGYFGFGGAGGAGVDGGNG
ncbi:hypothetical protein ACT18_25255, partial [Mycolicibacter kumamotonensis]